MEKIKGKITNKHRISVEKCKKCEIGRDKLLL